MGFEFQITCTELAAVIGTPLAPRIIDVCLPEDHALDPRVIPGAQRFGFREAAEIDTDAPMVIACQKGFKLSQGVASALRARGVDARFLRGGMVGWAEASLPLLPSAAHPTLGQHAQRWVLSQTLTPSDMFAAWCVQRFVDPDALWLFVEPAQVELVADRFATHACTELTALICEQLADIATLRAQSKSQPFASLLKGACAGARDPAEGVNRAVTVLDAALAAIRVEEGQ